MLVFSTQLCELGYCPFNILSGSPPPPLPPSQSKPRKGGWPQTDKHLTQSPFTSKFFYITIFGITFYKSNLPTPPLFCRAGKKLELYSGSKTIDALRSYVKKMAPKQSKTTKATTQTTAKAKTKTAPSKREL